MDQTTEILLDLANRRYITQRDAQVITHCEALTEEARDMPKPVIRIEGCCDDLQCAYCEGNGRVQVEVLCDLDAPLSTGTLTVEEQVELLRPFH